MGNGARRSPRHAQPCAPARHAVHALRGACARLHRRAGKPPLPAAYHAARFDRDYGRPCGRRVGRSADCGARRSPQLLPFDRRAGRAAHRRAADLACRKASSRRRTQARTGRCRTARSARAGRIRSAPSRGRRSPSKWRRACPRRSWSAATDAALTQDVARAPARRCAARLRERRSGGRRDGRRREERARDRRRRERWPGLRRQCARGADHARPRRIRAGCRRRWAASARR